MATSKSKPPSSKGSKKEFSDASSGAGKKTSGIRARVKAQATVNRIRTMRDRKHGPRG